VPGEEQSEDQDRDGDEVGGVEGVGRHGCSRSMRGERTQ
jgi:hypothetical protein